jgi:hypothetical protein
MPNTETPAAPRNTEEQLVGRAVLPVVDDWFEKVAATVTVTAVHPDGGVSFRYHGLLIESDHWVCRADYDKLVRKIMEHGATFHPANAGGEGRA